MCLISSSEIPPSCIDLFVAAVTAEIAVARKPLWFTQYIHRRKKLKIENKLEYTEMNARNSLPKLPHVGTL